MIKLLSAMVLICSVYEDAFRKLEHVPEEAAGQNTVEKVKFVLTDLPYNALQKRNDDNAEHDVLKTADIRDMAEGCERVMKPSAHGWVFCSSA